MTDNSVPRDIKLLARVARQVKEGHSTLEQALITAHDRGQEIGFGAGWIAAFERDSDDPAFVHPDPLAYSFQAPHLTKEKTEMNEYKQYRRSQIAEMADWEPGFNMTGVSVSDADRQAGSPKVGDKIARNPKNHDDRWLVAAAYAADNFEPVTD